MSTKNQGSSRARQSTGSRLRDTNRPCQVVEIPWPTHLDRLSPTVGSSGWIGWASTVACDTTLKLTKISTTTLTGPRIFPALVSASWCTATTFTSHIMAGRSIRGQRYVPVIRNEFSGALNASQLIVSLQGRVETTTLRWDTILKCATTQQETFGIYDSRLWIGGLLVLSSTSTRCFLHPLPSLFPKPPLLLFRSVSDQPRTTVRDPNHAHQAHSWMTMTNPTMRLKS